MNAIGALLNGKILTVALFSGTVNSALFLYWVLHQLLPRLPANSVVVMDNASFHKRADIQQAFRDAGHHLEYLPAYSPDLNPIEKKWAHMKSICSKLRCDVDTLFREHSA